MWLEILEICAKSLIYAAENGVGIVLELIEKRDKMLMISSKTQQLLLNNINPQKNKNDSLVAALE